MGNLKIKIKIPEHDSTVPSQFCGKEALVEIESVKFSDGYTLYTGGTGITIVEDEAKSTYSLRELLGQDAAQLNVEFK